MKKSIFVVKKVPSYPVWSDFEDDIIKSVIKIRKRNKWKFFAEKFINKTPTQCHNRSKILNLSIKKGKWSKEEDERLLNLYQDFGNSWRFISKIMKTRNTKQIRLRFKFHLQNGLNRSNFTKEEDDNILKLYQIYKNKWSLYKRILKDRSPQRIKTRYFILIKGKNFNTKINSIEKKISENKEENLYDNKNFKEHDTVISYFYFCDLSNYIENNRTINNNLDLNYCQENFEILNISSLS